jgi:hypothetical protein
VAIGSALGPTLLTATFVISWVETHPNISDTRRDVIIRTETLTQAQNNATNLRPASNKLNINH